MKFMNSMSLKPLIADRREEGVTPLRQVQLVELRLLEVLVDICERHKLRYWLDFGTLLGAARHEGFIPWDDDLDVSMPREDFNCFCDIAQREVPSDVFVQTMATDPGYLCYAVPLKLRDKYSTMIEHREEIAVCHQGIYIDVFPADRTPRNKVLRNFQRSLYKSIVVGHYQNLPASAQSWYNSRSARKQALRFVDIVFPIKLIAKLIFKLYALEKKYLYRTGLESKVDDYFFEPEDLFPLRKLTFEGREYWVPKE